MVIVTMEKHEVGEKLFAYVISENTSLTGNYKAGN